MKKIFYLIFMVFCITTLLVGCGVDESSDKFETGNLQEENIETEVSGTVNLQEENLETEVSETEETLVSEVDTVDKIASDLYDEYYPVYLFIDYEENLILGKDKKLKIYIDGNELEQVEQGASTCYAMVLSKGEHMLKVATSFINSDSKEFIVDADAYMDDIPNFIYCELAFKSGDATITSLFSIDEAEFVDYTEIMQYYGMTMSRAQEQYIPIGDFEKIMKRHEEIS